MHLKKQVAMTAEAARGQGDYCKIGRTPTTVSVCVDGNQYFFQENEAEALLEGIPAWANPEDYILWEAQGW